MFINKIHLQNFKRFTDLTIDLSGLTAPPKLVLMIGANGSGKSSVFDAFEAVSIPGVFEKVFGPKSGLYRYFQKDADQIAMAEIGLSNGTELRAIENENGGMIEGKPERYAAGVKAFYGRSALRQIPRLLRTSRQAQEETLFTNADKPKHYIEADLRFENDLDIQTDRLLQDVFEGQSYETQGIRDKYVKPINDALARIFADEDSVNLRMYSVKPPLNGKPTNLRFRKGISDLHYDLLSTGEKEVVNILFNLLTRRAFFDDTIYFIDELDAHLNTALQYNLLKEITENWLPENCQLWTASHSLGFIKYAQESTEAVILDFDQFDFDVPQTLTPLPKSATEIYEIAVPADVLPSLFQGKQLIFCENQNDRFYQSLGFSEKIFYGVRDKNDVYYRAKNNPDLFGLIDRDYLTEVEITRIREKLPNLYVLKYYAFENYLYHPANLAEVVPSFEVTTYQAEITRQKNASYTRIVYGLKQARSGYKVLMDEKLEDENVVDAIESGLKSDDFETFYPYFDMKSKFNHQSLAALNLPTEKLVRTNWFRTALRQVFSNE